MYYYYYCSQEKNKVSLNFEKSGGEIMTFIKIGLLELRFILKKTPRLLLGMLIFPFIYLMLYGFLFDKHSVDKVPMIICDESQTAISRKITREFEDSENFSIIGYLTTEEEVKAFLNEKKADLALIIPNDFSKSTNSGHSARILLEINGDNLIVSNISISIAQDIINKISSDVGGFLLEKRQGILPNTVENKIHPVKMQLRMLYNPLLSYQYYFVVCLIMMSFQTSLFISSSATMFMEYKLKNLINYNAFDTVIGKLIPFWLGGTFIYIMLLALINIIWKIPFRGSLGEIILIGSSFIFLVTTLGSFLVSYFENMLTFYRFTIASSVIIFTLSGTTWPIQSMPLVIKVISNVIPYTYFGNNVRNLMLIGHTPHLYYDSIGLFSFGIIFIFLSAYRMKKIRMLK